MILIDHLLNSRPNLTPKLATHCSSYVFYHLEFLTTFHLWMQFNRLVLSTAN